MITEIKLPSPGESVTEVQISKWLKKDGEFVEKDEEIAEIDSDKATLTLNAEVSGILKILVKEGETVPIGSVACTIDSDVKTEQRSGNENKKTDSVPAVKTGFQEADIKAAEKEAYAKGLPSVAASKIMREQSIGASEIKGTGKDGRITKTDVLEKIKQKEPEISTIAPSVKATSAPSNVRTERRVKMSLLRKKIAQRLVAVKNETAMLTTFNEADMSNMMAIRKQYKDVFQEKYHVSLGFMSFFTRAVVESLKSFPALNARIEGDEIIYHDYVDIGIAVSTPKGLMVPILRNAESMDFAIIESAITDLAGKARDGKLSIEEMSGGTFTITNGGIFGSMMSTPIINPPQSAILGMHNIVNRPVAVDGAVVIRPMMYLAVSYDHRIIDGRESVGFLVKVRQMVEEPLKTMFEGNEPVKSLLGI